ncbi:MAG TPA: 4Fe-4S dicluster domain-containing protein [Chondromyces sp.]|nr:4Fe-4S dicluster domain-containing protein [Chondromyces sp.]
MSSDRRDFLLAAGKYLIMTAVTARAVEHVVAGTLESAPEYGLYDHWWAMAIDIDKCIGCGGCVRACKTENGVSREPYYFRTWVERYHVPEGDIEHPVVDSPNGGHDGFPERYRPGDGSKNFFVPKLCNHCAHSPCVQVCPVGATFESPDGVVLVDKGYCLGCRYCVQACPYGCRYIDPETHSVDKCSLCYHRITKGLTTACCEVCPTGARMLGDLKDPDDPIQVFLRENMVQVLKPQMATGSKVYYADLDGSVR